MAAEPTFTGNRGLAALLSLPGTGRGDRAKRGGWGPSPFQRRHDGVQHMRKIAVNLVVPEPQHPEPVCVEVEVALDIAGRAMVERVLSAIDLDYEVMPDADEIDDVLTPRPLTAEVIAAPTPAAQVNPELYLLRRHRSTQPARTFVRHDLPVRAVPWRDGRTRRTALGA